MTSPGRFVWMIPFGLAVTASIAGAYVRVGSDSEGAIGTIADRVLREPRPAVQRQLSQAPAWSSFQHRYGTWTASWNEATHTPHRAFGRAIPLTGFRDDATAVDRSVRDFVAQNAPLLGSAPQLALTDTHRAGNVWYVRYQQMVSGVPVLNADWEFRVAVNGNLMAFGADHYAVPTGLVTSPRIPLSVAREAAKRGLAFDAARDRVDGDRLYILPVNRGGATNFRLVYELHVITMDPRQSWYTLVDAANGEIVQRSSMLRHLMTGNVNATVHPLLPTDPLQTKPLRSATVNIGALAVNTDSLGNYSGASTGTVVVTSAFLGPYCNVDRCVSDVCPTGDGSFSKSTSSSPTNIAWLSTNSQQSERDAFYHVNRAHSYVKTLDPTYTANDYPLTTYTDLSDNCNAFWDFGTNSLSLLSAGSGCPNTASTADLVYHEYGHAVNDNLYVAHGRPQGLANQPLSEGLADVYDSYMIDNPVIGSGLFGPGTSLRTCLNTRQWPQDWNAVDPQETGEILAGAMWELRQSLGLATAGRLMHYAKYGLADDNDDGVAFNEYFVDVLVADDNNGNLSDGTPHYNQIVAAFNNHGIGTNYFIGIDVVADDQPNTGPFPVTATISYNGTFGGLDVTSPRLFYSINGAAFTSAPMFPTGNPDEYGAQVPAQASAVIRCYVRASTIDGGVKTQPAGAPGRYFSFIGGPFSTLLENDFDNDLGWTVGAAGDAATTGIWIRAVPVGSAVQPGADHSPNGTLCYVTGNALPDDPPAVNDVDGGKTTLTSSTFDATAGGLIRPVVSYWRWYSNNGGDNPGQDPWKVDISNNGGSTWTPVENTLETDQSWRRVMFSIKDYVTPTNNMKMRFVATDDLTFPSIVEAAVDDFALYAFPTSVGVDDHAPAAVFQLAPASPNPFRGSTQLVYSLASRGPVTLAVFDIQGRLVRSLVAGNQEAGRHSSNWDGRDAAGRPVANGPYFVRLAQQGARSSQAIVLMR